MPRVLPLAVAALAAQLAARPAVAQTATITFQTLTAPDGTGFTGFVQAGYEVSADPGTWRIGQANGNPPPSLHAGPGAEALHIERVIEGTFRFVRLDLLGEAGATGVVVGLRDGQIAFSAEFALAEGWNTYPTPDTTSIDALVILVSAESGSVHVDNVVLDRTPSADFNGDGEVNVADLLAFLAAFRLG